MDSGSQSETYVIWCGAAQTYERTGPKKTLLNSTNIKVEITAIRAEEYKREIFFCFDVTN